MNTNKPKLESDLTKQSNNKNIIRTDNLYLRKILEEEKILTYEDKKTIAKMSIGKIKIPDAEDKVIINKNNNAYKSKLRNKNK